MALDRSSRLDYSGLGCQCRLNKGGILFRRTRYQQGSLRLEERKRGAAVWVYRWWENDITGKPIRRKVQLGCLERYPNESAARSEEHTSELQSPDHLVCRLLLEKKKTTSI